MSQLQIFKHDMFGVLPVITDNGTEWFGATEAAKALSFSDPYAAIRNHIEVEDLTVHQVPTEGGIQQKKFTNESGLYSLIFGAAKQGNNLEIQTKAKTFKRWVTSEVLPSIRNVGSYYIQQPVALEDLIIMQAQSVKELKAQVASIGATVTTIQETFLHRDVDWRKSINNMLNRAAFQLGGQYRDLRNKSYDMLEQRGRCDLNKRLRNLLDRLEHNGATKTQMDNTSKMDVIEADARLKEIYSTIVKELSIGSIKAV